MQQNRPEDYKGEVYFVYDGDCPICHYAAHALRIRQQVGPLSLVNAREDATHPVLASVTARGFDLDAGMVLVLGDDYYHGADALEVMGRLGAPSGWFNRVNSTLFRSRFLARLCYPFMRAGRNAVILWRGVPKLRNLQAARSFIFEPVFGNAWHALPPVMQKHYAVRAGSDDIVRVQGTLDVVVSWPVRMLARMIGMLVPYEGKHVPVSVTFRTSPETGAFHFERRFDFPNKSPVYFRSHMQPVGGNEVVEWMRFGLGWRCAYAWDGTKVTLTHRGYVLRLFGWLLPLPLELLLGKGYAEEVPLTEDSFAMWTHTKHRWFGETFRYGGEFKIAEVICSQP